MPLRFTLKDVLLIAVWRVGFGREQLIAWVDRVLVVQRAIKGGVLHALPRGREQTTGRLNIETRHLTATSAVSSYCHCHLTAVYSLLLLIRLRGLVLNYK